MKKKVSTNVVGLIWGIGLLSLGIWAFFPGCSSKPECFTDAECTPYGDDYGCHNLKCLPGDQLPKSEQPKEIPLPDLNFDGSSESVKESSKDTKPPENPPTDKGPSNIKIVKQHEPCDWYPDRFQRRQVSRKCGTGLKCVRVDAFEAICMIDCSRSSQICKSNGKGYPHCQKLNPEPNGTVVSVCVKQAKRNQSCEPKLSIYCQEDSAPYTVCRNGKCEDAKQCNTNGCDCTPSNTPPHKICGSGLVCVEEKTGYKCRRGQKAFEGEECDTVSRLCPAGYHCLKISSKSFCYKKCDLSNPVGTCLQNPKLQCKQFGFATPVCAQLDCKSATECVFTQTYHSCRQERATKKNFCSPITTTNGSIGFAGLCKASENRFCKHPFECINFGSDGMCMMQCSDNNDCIRFHPNGKCSLRNNVTGVSLCSIECSLDANCPKGLVCRPLQQGSTGKLCLPPS